MEQISTELHADGPKPLDHSLRARILSAVSQAGPTETPPIATKPARKRLRPLTVCAGAATAVVAWFTLYPLLHGDVLRSMTPMHRTQSNMKQIGIGVMMYNQDNDVTLAQPPAAAGSSAGPDPSLSPGAAMSAAAPMPHIASAHQPLAQGKRDNGFTLGLQRQQKLAKAENERQAYYFPKLPGNTQAGAGEAQAPIGGIQPQRARPATRSPLMMTEGGKETVQQQLATLADEEKVERTVNHTASLTVQVDNVETRSETVAQYAQTAGGFVANNQLSTGDDDAKTATLTLKVPVAQFETVLNQVAHLGEVKAKNLTGEDLTDQISDQEQSEHILRQDINTTQEELTHRLTRSGRQERLDTLRELRTRIAQTSARLKLLRRLGALSTISVELDERPRVAPPAPKTGGFVDDMNNALHGAMRSMMEAARLPILAFIWILAYSPLWILLILGYRYAVRRA